MKEKSILNKVRTLLGMEVKLEMMKLEDGVTVIEAEMFESENEVFIVTDDEQRIPVPVGEYTLENGMMLVVVEEGIISEIKEATAEEEEVEPEPEVEVEAEKAVNPIAKKVIESTVKESHFSEIEELKKEIEELKVALSAKQNEEATEEVAPVELAEEVKPISFNPENETPIEVVRYGKKGGVSQMEKILNKINNI
jgi:hypothetical protein